MKKITLLIVLIGFLFIVSCGSKKDEIEDSYLIELENQYNEDIDSTIQIETPETFMPEDSNMPTNVNNGKANNENLARQSSNSIPATRTKYADTTGNYKNQTQSSSTVKAKKLIPAKPKTFTSKWVDTKDSQVIKDVRLLIASRQYRKAQRYINNLNMDNLPSTDIGHLYQFKGIVHYFLVPIDDEAFTVSIESFQKAYEETGIEKFKPLSVLWLGMLYEKYSNNTVELQQAINLFDEVINEHSSTRFVNDAVFYKALVLKKLGRHNEYDELILSLKNNVYPDNLIYSRWNNDYIHKNIILSKYAKGE